MRESIRRTGHFGGGTSEKGGDFKRTYHKQTLIAFRSASASSNGWLRLIGALKRNREQRIKETGPSFSSRGDDSGDIIKMTGEKSLPITPSSENARGLSQGGKRDSPPSNLTRKKKVKFFRGGGGASEKEKDANDSTALNTKRVRLGQGRGLRE